MATVRLADVGKRYENGANAVDAVQHLDLVVEDGDFVVLVGPSGCGKTTILRLIAGLETATAGTISIGDVCVNKTPPRDREVAMVFQDFALYPHMTVAKNLAFALSARQVAKTEMEQRVASVAEMLGLGELLQRYPQELSGGQQQRVAVGRAIVRQPEVYLFDEPLSNLDSQLRFGMRSELKRIHAQLRTTTIHVTHDQEEAMALGDKIVVMNRGKIHQYGAPQEIYDKPADRFVAEFIGTPAMNFLHGQISKSSNGRVCFACSDDSVLGPAKLPIPPGQADRLCLQDGKQAVMGIRPEDVAVAALAADTAEKPDSVFSVAAKTELIERLGAFTDIHTSSANGSSLTVRSGSRDLCKKLKPDDPIVLSVDADRVHFFEPGEFGRRVSEGEAQDA